jgi:radical SAM protein (TIGR01212 family)
MEERFYSLGRYLKKTFDERVHRISINVAPGEGAGAYSLCTGSIIDLHHDEASTLPVREQIYNAKERTRQRFKFGKFLAGLHSSPLSPVTMDSIGAAMEEVMKDNEIIGASITVRPDSITDEMRKFLKKTSKEFSVWVEPGLLTVHDETLSRMGLGWTYAQTKDALLSLLGSKLHIAGHLVFGLPGETELMMHKTIKEISRLAIGGVNIHNMYVCKNTQAEQDYVAGKTKLLTRQEYVNLVCDFIEHLPSACVLHGIVDSVVEDKLAAPEWMKMRKENLDAITAELEKRNTMQGAKFEQLKVMEFKNARSPVEPLSANIPIIVPTPFHPSGENAGGTGTLSQ